MYAWGRKLTGKQTKVSENHELQVGDRCRLVSEKSEMMLSPSEIPTMERYIVYETKLKYEMEQIFEPKYIQCSIAFKSGATYTVKVESHLVVLQASPLAISATWLAVAFVLVVLGIVIAIAVLTYYVIEEFLPPLPEDGWTWILIILVVILAIVYFVRRG